MTKFDFKQWIINNKATNKKNEKIKALVENYEMLNEQPPPPAGCDNFIGQNIGCESWTECGTGTQVALHFMGGAASFTNTQFHAWSGSPSNGTVKKFTDNSGTVRKFTYNGVVTGTTTENLGNSADWTVSNCCNCGCVYGCTDSTATNYNSSATCDDGSCIFLGPGYSECINCCCNAHMQMENIDPTIDAISKLITLAEQRRRTDDAEREPSRREIPTISRPEDQPKGKDGRIRRPSDDVKGFSISPVTGDPAVAPGVCSANHYTSTQPWTLIDTSDPDINTLDPVTGLCECDPTAYPTVATTMNPSPQTLDANNDPVGVSAPCP